MEHCPFKRWHVGSGLSSGHSGSGEGGGGGGSVVAGATGPDWLLPGLRVVTSLGGEGGLLGVK